MERPTVRASGKVLDKVVRLELTRSALATTVPTISTSRMAGWAHRREQPELTMVAQSVVSAADNLSSAVRSLRCRRFFWCAFLPLLAAAPSG